ncbi:unnamed protein product [Dicrocoelium dendriticum]|nr:unnamed protein product [Dicrocoelium dendriticum]
MSVQSSRASRGGGGGGDGGGGGGGGARTMHRTAVERIDLYLLFFLVSVCLRVSAILQLGNKLATSRKRFILPSNDCAEKTLRADARPSSPQPSVHVICSSIRWKILSVYFHHWLIFCRKLRMLKTRLSGVVFRDLITIDRPTHAPTGLSAALWDQITSGMAFDFTFREVCRHVYFGNCDPSIRPKVWPYLLGVYPWKASPEELEKLNFVNKSRYFHARSQWQSCPDSATNPHKQWEVNDFRNNHKLKNPSLLDISRGAHSRRWSADVHPDEINTARLRNKSTEVTFNDTN